MPAHSRAALLPRKTFSARAAPRGLRNSASAATRTRLRERAGAASSRQRFHSRVALAIPMESLFRSTGAQGCIFLGWSRCGTYLLSYSFDSGLRFELQAWRFASNRQPRLHIVTPLFPNADWGAASTMGGLVEGTSIRVCIWEPPGSGCLVVTGFLHERSAFRVPMPYHVSIIPGLGPRPETTAYFDACVLGDAPRLAVPSQIATSDASRQQQQQLSANDDADSAVPHSWLIDVDVDDHAAVAAETDDVQANTAGPHHGVCAVNAAHFSYTVQAPYPRPSIVGLEAVAPQSKPGCGPPPCHSRTYRLSLNCGDSLKIVTFAVRCVGESPSSRCNLHSTSLVNTPSAAAAATAAATSSSAPAWFIDTSIAAARETHATLADSTIAAHYASRLDTTARLSSNSDDTGGKTTMASTVSSLGPSSSLAENSRDGFTFSVPARTTSIVAHTGTVLTTLPALHSLDPIADPRALCGSVFVLECVTIDYERLLGMTVKGRLLNYDARLVLMQDSQQQRRTTLLSSSTAIDDRAEANGGGDDDHKDDGDVVDIGDSSWGEAQFDRRHHSEKCSGSAGSSAAATAECRRAATAATSSAQRDDAGVVDSGDARFAIICVMLDHRIDVQPQAKIPERALAAPPLCGPASALSSSTETASAVLLSSSSAVASTRPLASNSVKRMSDAVDEPQLQERKLRKFSTRGSATSAPVGRGQPSQWDDVIGDAQCAPPSSALRGGAGAQSLGSRGNQQQQQYAVSSVTSSSSKISGDEVGGAGQSLPHSTSAIKSNSSDVPIPSSDSVGTEGTTAVTLLLNIMDGSLCSSSSGNSSNSPSLETEICGLVVPTPAAEAYTAATCNGTASAISSAPPEKEDGQFTASSSADLSSSSSSSSSSTAASCAEEAPIYPTTAVTSDIWDPFYDPNGPKPAIEAVSAAASRVGAPLPAAAARLPSSVSGAGASSVVKTLVVNASPAVRLQCVLCVDVHTGAARVLRLTKAPPQQQPAFVSRDGKTSTGALTGLTTAMVNTLRAVLRPAIVPGKLMTREINNDAVLSGISLPKLSHPVLPVALVL